MNTKTTLLAITSKERTYDSKSSSNFSYSIGMALEVDTIAIKSISIPVTQYNITSFNNFLYTTLGISESKISLPVGQYTLAQITSYLIDVFDSYGILLTIIQNPITYKLQITTDVPFTLNPESTLLPVLGIITTIPLLITTSYGCTALPQLQGLKNFYILTKVLSQGSNGLFVNGVNEALQTNVPISVPFGLVQHYEPKILDTNLITFKSPVNIQYLDIRIVDSNLNEVDLNGSEVELVYKLYIKNQYTR
jgi:hypothetical protein